MEEVPEVELEPETEPEPEPESEPEPKPKAKPRKKPEPDPEPDLGLKKAGRPKKDPGAPKAKYTPRKAKAPEVVREVVEVPVVREPDKAHFARQVVSTIGQIRQDHFNARRENWRTMVSENYR